MPDPLVPLAAPTDPAERPPPRDTGGIEDPGEDDAIDPHSDWPDDEAPADRDLELLEEWPDDQPVDDPTGEAPLALEPDFFVDVDDDDDGGTELEASAEVGVLEPEPILPVVLPWRTRAWLPEHGRTVDALLDPTLERTRWSGGEPGLLKIVLGEVEALVEVEVVAGAQELLRVGRDVLSGRILVES